MESEMIERVARALCDADAGKTVYDDNARMEEGSGLHVRDRNLWRAQARVAIMAMRDRDEAMLDAGTAVLWPHAQRLAPGSTAVAVYEAMIDAALGRVAA